MLLAGCSGNDGEPDDGSTAGGTFRLWISDQPVAIEDFASLDVTLSAARVWRADEDDGSEGFAEFDLDSVTVDLTRVEGDRAVSVLAGELDEGRYSGIELRITSAEGVVDGEAVDVMVPSDRLHVIKPFEIGTDEEPSFVFDIEDTE